MTKALLIRYDTGDIKFVHRANMLCIASYKIKIRLMTLAVERRRISGRCFTKKKILKIK